jgi:uncharacterized membrane protein
MTAAAVALVLASGLCHATWNLMAKSSGNKSAFLWICQLIAIVLFLPWTVWALRDWSYTPEAGVYLAASAALHGLYVWLLARAYTIGDLSLAYPIMRGTSPLLVPLGAVLLMGQHVSPWGWVGIAGIVIGIAALQEPRRRGSGRFGKPAAYAFAVGLTVTCYTLVDAQALQVVPAVVLNEAGNIGNALALSAAALTGGAVRMEWAKYKRSAIIAGILAPAGYLLFLFALHYGPVSLLMPVREIGTVFGTVGAIWLLKEQQGFRRVMASIVITCGIIVLGIGG